MLIANCAGNIGKISLPNKNSQGRFIICSLKEYKEQCKTSNVFLFSKEECLKCKITKEQILFPYLEEKEKAIYELNYTYLSPEDLKELEVFHKELFIKFYSFPTLCAIRENRKISLCENNEDFIKFMDARII